MYADLRAALADARNRLHETLDRLATNQSGVEPVGEPLAGLPQGVDRSDVQQLRDEVVTSEAELRDLEEQVVWRAAELGRDDIVTLNRARLMLLDLASDDLHARMTGFGIDGVAQVEREIEQIGLELRYRLLSLPRFGRSLLDAFERSPLPVVFAFLQLAFVILVFRWWRQRAARQLEQWRAALLARDPSPVQADDESSLAWTLRRVLATGLWYLARVRRPLEWLLLFALVFRVVVARGAAMVRLFAEPPAAELDDVGPTMHFVLRAVVQLEVARPDDLVACTQLPADDVADALRFASARGWIARVVGSDERYRVTWHWYRAITDMLRRQHLLAI